MVESICSKADTCTSISAPTRSEPCEAMSLMLSASIAFRCDRRLFRLGPVQVSMHCLIPGAERVFLHGNFYASGGDGRLWDRNVILLKTLHMKLDSLFHQQKDFLFGFARSHHARQIWAVCGVIFFSRLDDNSIFSHH